MTTKTKSKELCERINKLFEETPANKNAYKAIDKHMDNILKEIKKSAAQAKKLKPSDEMMERLHERLEENAEQLKRMIIR